MEDDQVLQLEDTAVESMPSEQPQEKPETAEASTTQEPEQARNFRKIKELKERAERERDEAIRYIKQIQAAQNHQETPQPIDEDDLQIGAEDYVEGKTVKKVYKQVRELKKQLQQYQQNSAEAVAETKLKALHPDADRVMSAENITSLRERYPEIAHTINTSNGDMYSKMYSVYTMIKNLGIHQEEQHLLDKQLAQKNAAKPRPLTSISPQQGDTPLSKANAFANGLTEELRQQLYKEMMEAMKAR